MFGDELGQGVVELVDAVGRVGSADGGPPSVARAAAQERRPALTAATTAALCGPAGSALQPLARTRLRNAPPMYAFIDTASHAGGDLSSIAPTAIRSRTADRPDAGSTRQRERRKSLCCGPCQGRSSSLTIWFRRSYGCLISRRHHWNTHQAKGVNHGSFGKILNNYAERTLVLPSRPTGGAPGGASAHPGARRT